eukprot:10798775-Ditylum_brightwellii.AAC.1
MYMMLMQLPVDEDYLKEGKCGAITYAAFKQWMSHGRFRFVKNTFACQIIAYLQQQKQEISHGRHGMPSLQWGVYVSGSCLDAVKWLHVMKLGFLKMA